LLRPKPGVLQNGIPLARRRRGPKLASKPEKTKGRAMMQRRRFLKSAAVTGLAGLGDFGFLSRLRPVSAAEARLDARSVLCHPEIGPLVRLIEDTPRDRLLEEVAARLRRGSAVRLGPAAPRRERIAAERARHPLAARCHHHQRHAPRLPPLRQ
jgi:hypothetical protein